MAYKPKFCCECGEKIERLGWKPWTSRRFCSLCATEYGTGEKLQMIFLAAAVFLGLAGAAAFWQKNEKSSAAATNLVAADKNKIQINQTADWRRETVKNTSEQPSTQTQTTNSATETNAKTQNLTPHKLKTEKNKLEQISSADEIVYFCGAQTKKGTPCLRRMKGGGRCWQHVGLAAMLPPEKLIVSNN